MPCSHIPAVFLALTKTKALSLGQWALACAGAISEGMEDSPSVSDTKLQTFLHLHSITAAERGQPQKMLHRELGILFH